MCPQLGAAFRKLYPEAKVSYFGGLFRSYRAGGFGGVRIVNLIWMSSALPFRLLFGRFDRVIVRTTPPLLHLWAALWLRLLRIPAALWLMDDHPQIELRLLQGKPLFAPLCALLRRWDRLALRFYKPDIVMDAAMEAGVHARVPEAQTIIFPTWPQVVPQTSTWRPRLPDDSYTPLKLLYGGHLGEGHELGLFQDLIQNLSMHQPVELHWVGGNESGKLHFTNLISVIRNLRLHVHPRMPFEDLVSWIQSEQIHYGIVLMRQDMKGLLSPSKFAAYLAAGIPTLYFGPSDTNAHAICERFQGGRAFTSASSDDTKAEAAKLLNPKQYSAFVTGTQAAREHFFSFTPDKLAEVVVTFNR